MLEHPKHAGPEGVKEIFWILSFLHEIRGEGKITYMFSANANVLSANFLFSVLPAGGEGVGTF
jgi:hypothetical protein